ncbi:MAG TPA: hypothetical protein VN455_08930, partial [Methanotrichaceae archaeon]|nr:hypothetical protein [Methanotrichaceae archaeon]
VIDPYIKATNWGFNLFDFYEKNREDNKIYFIGDSLTAYGVDPVIVENILRTSNQSFKVYNIAYPRDRPASRLVELKGIVESRPKIVVIGMPYYWLDPSTDELEIAGDYRETRSLLASDKIEQDPYSRSLFNKSQLEHIQMDLIDLVAYKKRFFTPGIRLILYNFGWGCYDPVKEYFNTTEMRPWTVFNRGMFNFRDQFDPGNGTQPAFDGQCPIVLTGDNENKQAIKHIVEYLMSHEIYVIIANMPMSPYRLSDCDDNHTNTLRDFAASMRCPYYDLESLCSADEFRDMGHANYAGRQKITRKMAEIILRESKNVSL